MTITRLFSTVFDEEMKSRGYKRKGRVYYKLDGEILKGVARKTTNPYSIHFYAAPYWFEHHGENWWSFNKGYWAEDGFDIIPGVTSYYREENETLNRDWMDLCFDIARKYILPHYEKVVDIDTYIEMGTSKGWESLGDQPANRRILNLDTSTFGNRYEYLNDDVLIRWHSFYLAKAQYAFLYKAYKEGSFENAANELKKYAEYNTPDEAERTSYTSVFFDIMNKGDLEWIERYKQQRKAIIAPRLRDELGLDTFHL